MEDQKLDVEVDSVLNASAAVKMESTNVDTAVNDQKKRPSSKQETLHTENAPVVPVSNRKINQKPFSYVQPQPVRSMHYHHPGHPRERVKTFEPLELRRKKSLYVGNLDSGVYEDTLYQIFSKFARVVDVKIHRGDLSTYGFVQFESEDLAQAALNVMDGTMCRGRPMRVRWSGMPATPHLSMEALNSCFNVYVRNLSGETTSETLKIILGAYGDVVDANVVSIPSATQPMSYAFVYFRYKNDAERLINEIKDMWIDNRNVRFSWATAGYQNQEYDYQQYEEGEGDGAWSTGGKANLSYWNVFSRGGNSTSVYIGNLPPATGRMDVVGKLEQRFSQFGKVLNVKVFPGKLYAFVEFGSKDEAATAIINCHAALFEGRRMKCFWGKEQQNPNGNHEVVNANSTEGHVDFGQGPYTQLQQYDHQSYINAPLQQEIHHYPSIDNMGYYGVGYSNNFNGEGHVQGMQPMPYQPEGQMFCYTIPPMMPNMPMPQPIWHPNQGSEGMWVPVPAEGGPNPMFVGGQEPYLYNATMPPVPHPDYQFWYSETTDGPADPTGVQQVCGDNTVEYEVPDLASLKINGDEDPSQSDYCGENVQDFDDGINGKNFEQSAENADGTVEACDHGDSGENGADSPEN